MPIVVDSSQWTGEPDDSGPTGPVVWGGFPDRPALDRAATTLQAEPWFQAVHGAAGGRRADNAQVDAPDDDPKGADRRNLRQNFVGTAAASTSMLAAGIVIATGGAALPAVAAAAAAGLATGAIGEAAGTALPSTGSGRCGPDEATQTRPEALALGVLAPNAAIQAQAERFLRQQGADRVWVQAAPGATPAA